jgi:tRNA threonylcarbamoyladenosine biosynthesis protein TsaB
VIVLGFDTATHATAVGLRLADGSALQARDDPPAGAHPGHATRLLGMADELLAQAGLGWERVERIAAGRGPGRFTGLRVGIATARALAQSLRVELVGVSSLRALALGAASDTAEPVPTLAVIDARRGEAFVGAYSAAAVLALSEPISDGAQLTGELLLERALRAEQLSEIVAEVERLGGSRGEHWRAVGDGALLYREQLRDAGVEVAAEDSPLHLIDGAAVCRLGALAPGASKQPEQLLPDYRRSPDAALVRERSAVMGGAS